MPDFGLKYMLLERFIIQEAFFRIGGFLKKAVVKQI